MFGYKSAGIGEKLANILPTGHIRRANRDPPVLAPETPGMARADETYIAATQFTVASTPFFRWNQ